VVAKKKKSKDHTANRTYPYNILHILRKKMWVGPATSIASLWSGIFPIWHTKCDDCTKPEVGSAVPLLACKSGTDV